MAQEVKYRPATMAEIEGRDVELYMNGERVWVMMIHRSETIGEDDAKLDYIMLTNMKKVQVEDLQVIDDTPEDSETKQTNNSNNNQNSTTMETKNMTAQDYVGKTIKVKDSTNYYVVKSADGETLQTEMHMGERVMPCPMPMTLLKTMLDAGKYVIGEDAVAEPVGNDNDNANDNQANAPEEPKSEDVKPVAQTVTMQPEPTISEPKKPSNKRQSKPNKSEGEKPDTMGVQKPTNGKGKMKANTLRYETYTNKNGKTCAKITGFHADDAAYQRAAELHASATYERTKQGDKVLFLIFGPRYAAAAKDVCRTLDMGGTMEQAKAIIDAATEERVQKREDWKARRAAYLAGKANSEGAQVKAEPKQGYSDADVAAMLKQIMAGGAIPEDIRKAMAA
jgi:hypothetical protein